MITFDRDNWRFQYRAACVAIDNNRALVFRAAEDDFWSIPGGRVEMGESATETLRREIREELHCEAEIGRLMFLGESFFEFRKRQIHELALYFEVTLPPELCARTKWEGEDAGVRLLFRWAPLAELESLRLHPPQLIDGLRNPPASTIRFVDRRVGPGP